MQRLLLQAAPCRRLSTARRLSSKRVLSSLTEEDLHGQHVLVRADLNVPVNKRTGTIAGTVLKPLCREGIICHVKTMFRASQAMQGALE